MSRPEPAANLSLAPGRCIAPSSACWSKGSFSKRRSAPPPSSTTSAAAITASRRWGLRSRKRKPRVCQSSSDGRAPWDSRLRKLKMRRRRTRFYRALLHLYPSSFRAEYAEEMCAVYNRRQTSRLAAVIEVLRNAPAVHWDILRQDLRYTARTLAGAPGFRRAPILVLALGIGANTAVFSVTDYVLIRPLPFPSPDRLVKLWETLPGYRHMELSPANYRDWNRMNTVFEDFGAIATDAANLVSQGVPERIQTAAVTGNLFRVLGVQPLLGHSITPADDQAGAPLTAVLSYGLWQRAFGGDAGECPLPKTITQH